MFSSGWISAISVIGSDVAVAVFMMVVAGFFTVNAVLAVILLKMVSKKMRYFLTLKPCPHFVHRSTLSTGGRALASKRPSRSSLWESSPTEPSRMLRPQRPPQLFREAFSNTGAD